MLHIYAILCEENAGTCKKLRELQKKCGNLKIQLFDDVPVA
jgi:hypothetical protein